MSEKDHAIGPADAPTTLLEYGDYQCPDCGEAEPILQEVRERMGDRLRFVFRNFPLIDLHENALAAAEAAEAADAQGKFWPMHDLLLANQESLTREDLEGYAQRLDLDTDAFRQALDGQTAKKAIMEEEAEGERSGVEGTPTIYINGVRYDGRFDAESIFASLRG